MSLTYDSRVRAKAQRSGLDDGGTMTTKRGDGSRAKRAFEALMNGQTLKFVIYGVLLLNFVQYFFEEAQQARLMLSAESPLLAWTGVFVTTIDELGWIGLLS